MNLRILQLGDSALPIGGFSHSWGLEAAIAKGQVQDAADLEHWIRQWLYFSLGPMEGVMAAGAFDAACEDLLFGIEMINTFLSVNLTPTTLRHASRDMGEQLLSLAEPWDWATDTVTAMRGCERVDGWHHAPVFGALANACGVTKTEALAVYLHQATLGVIGAGVRAIPIGHSHGQQVLARLQGDIEKLAGELAQKTLAHAGSNCPAYEVLCYEQSQLYTRLFRS